MRARITAGNLRWWGWWCESAKNKALQREGQQPAPEREAKGLGDIPITAQRAGPYQQCCPITWPGWPRAKTAG